MLAWSIRHALDSKYRKLMRIVVSTDSPEYAKIARECGGETPFLRPAAISEDASTDYECFDHALKALRQLDGYVPDVVVQLRPTQPCRTTQLLDDCLDVFLQSRDRYSSLRTVVPLTKSPFKMYTIADDTLVPVCSEINGLSEPYNLGRQQLPQAYLHNGYVDIINTPTLLQGSMTGERILPYVMTETDTVDIDTKEDLASSE